MCPPGPLRLQHTSSWFFTAVMSPEPVAVKISPEVVDADDVEMLEDLVLSGVREAQEAARKLQADTMGQVTGGMGGLPGMPF